MTAPDRLRRTTLTFLVIANMVGAGVFTTSGYTIAGVGSPAWVVAAWIVAGAIALAGAISYGALVRAMPESGGEYLFLARAAHPALGFIAGWVSLIAGFTGAIAFAATAFEGYLLPAAQRPDWLPADTLAVGLIVLGGLAHGLRPRLGAFVQNAAVMLKLGVLLAFLVFAATRLGDDVWQGAARSARPATATAMLAAFATALVWISLSYSGFNAAVYVAGEAQDPTRDVPRALIRGTLTVIVLYVALNAVFVYAPPPEQITGREDVAAIAARHLGGPRVDALVRGVIALALFTSVFSMVMAAPRVYAKMADDGLLPAALRLDGKVPGRAVAVQVALAAIFVLVSTLRGLLTYLGLTLSLCAAATVCCVLLPRVRRRIQHRAVYAAAIVYIACTLAAAGVMTANEPWQLGGTLVTFATGAAAYHLACRSKAT